MAKWADYLISQVAYDQNHLITKVRQHRDNGNTMGEGEVVDRYVIADNLGHGLSYMTVYGDLGKIRIGKNVRYFRAFNYHYIRIDGNKVSSDNLGELPQPDEFKQEEEPVLTETKPKQNTETKPLSELSSAFFSEQIEEELEPAAVEADVAPEPAAVEADVAPEPAKETRKKVVKRQLSTKKKVRSRKKSTKKKVRSRKKSTKKKVRSRKKSTKKKRA